MSFNKQIKNLTDRWLSKQKISEVLNVDENVINQTLEEIGMKEEADAHEKLIKDVESLHIKNMKPEAIAISLGVNLFQVKHIINNLPKKKEETVVKKQKVRKTYNSWTSEMDTELKDLVSKGYNHPKIAKKMNLTRSAVSKRWSRIRDKNAPAVKTFSFKKAKGGIVNRFTEEQDKQLIKLHNEGKTFGEIGKLTGRTTWTVTQRYGKIKSEVRDSIFKDSLLHVGNPIPTITEKDQKIIENINNVLKEPISINTFPINISVNKGEIIRYLIDNNLIEIKIQ